LSTILPRLISIYRAASYEPITGHCPFHFFNWRDAPFTAFVTGSGITSRAGIALQEVMFVEQFSQFISPRRIFIIGNALGWSTIALALIFPAARTVAIDIEPAGVALTNRLIEANGLSAKALVARSPDDVARVVDEHLDGAVEFSFIDGHHDNDTIKADFAAVKAVSTDDACHLFHDVINWNMIDGFKDLLATHGLQGKVFTRTPSGMGFAHGGNLSPDFAAYLDCFTDPPGMFNKLRFQCHQLFLDPIAAYHRSEVLRR
jgi:Methyltransferase domain